MSLATTQEHAEPENAMLRPKILRAGQDALAKAHPGARFQYVFHGSSGSKQWDLDRAISFGVVKMNLDTDAQYAFTRAIAGHAVDHWQGVLNIDGGADGQAVGSVQKTSARTGACPFVRDPEARPPTHVGRSAALRDPLQTLVKEEQRAG